MPIFEISMSLIIFGDETYAPSVYSLLSNVEVGDGNFSFPEIHEFAPIKLHRFMSMAPSSRRDRSARIETAPRRKSDNSRLYSMNYKLRYIATPVPAAAAICAQYNALFICQDVYRKPIIAILFTRTDGVILHKIWVYSHRRRLFPAASRAMMILGEINMTAEHGLFKIPTIMSHSEHRM